MIHVGYWAWEFNEESGNAGEVVLGTEWKAGYVVVWEMGGWIAYLFPSIRRFWEFRPSRGLWPRMAISQTTKRKKLIFICMIYRVFFFK